MMSKGKPGAGPALPLAREADLVVRESPEEVLVYDLRRHRAHCLGRTIASVWRRCDGRTTLARIAGAVRKETGVPLDEAAVALAVRRLSRARLLREAVVLPAPGSFRARRELVRRLAWLGGLSLFSITAPVAAQTATCIQVADCVLRTQQGGGCGNLTCCGTGLRCRPSGQAAGLCGCS
jgi:coenzyme PQQ synthesis protein D (PqqD)